MRLLVWAVLTAAGEAQTLIDLRTQTKSVDFSAATSTKPMQTGSSLPATCAVGQFFFLSSVPAGSNVYGCGAVNTWTLEGAALQALGGDISGSPGSVTVKALQGRAVSSTVPANGQVLEWNAGTSQWVPSASQTGNAAFVFVSQISLTIPGTVHQFGTANLIVNCFDSTTPPQQVEADKIQINPTTFNVTINFATAQSGYCVVNGAGTASVSGGGGIPPVGGDLSGNTGTATVTGLQNRPVASTAPTSGQALVWNTTASMWQPATVAGGGGGVTSTFGRTGAVTSLTGDYTFAQIAGTVASAQLPGASGDLSGTLTAATVTGIQSRAVANTAPSNGQALVWNGLQWAPGTVSGGGGGVSMASQLGDLAVLQTSPTVLTIGANCSPTSPCNVRFGYQVFTVTNSATATISGGTGVTGTAYIYINNNGTPVVGHNLNVACSAGCTQQAGVTSFPANVIPIYTWTATNGTWNGSAGLDQRAFLNTKTLAGGQGIIITETPGQSTLAVDTGVIPTYLTFSAALTFSSIVNNACAPDQSLTVAGANTGDAVAPAWPSTLPSGVLGVMFVSSTNTVNVRLCNLSGATVTLPSSTFRATIVRNY